MTTDVEPTRGGAGRGDASAVVAAGLASARPRRAADRTTDDAFDRLTRRHRECLRGVRRLLGSKEIAQALGIEKSTVDSYLTEAVKILGARNRRDAALMLEEHERARDQQALADEAAPPPIVPDKIGGDSARLSPPPPTPPSDVPPDELVVGRPRTPDERRRSPGMRLPYRRKGQADNDLSVGDRLIWIQVIAVGSAVGFGMLATGLQVVTELVESVARHLS